MVVCVLLTKKEAGNVNMLVESPKQPYTGITDSTGNEFHIPPLKKGFRNAKTKKKINILAINAGFKQSLALLSS